MLEIEQKFRAVDFDRLRERLQACAAKRGEVIYEADHYFNAPDRDFRETGEAFRLRRVGTGNRLTYKGPKLQTTVKARRELEIDLREGSEAAEEMMELLQALGYRHVAVVRKQREEYHLERDGFAVQVCLDDVADVGRFAEVEIVAPQKQLDQARTIVQTLADELGLSEVEPRSYLHLYLVAKGIE